MGANKTSFKKGHIPISPGRKPDTPEQKAIRTATKQALFSSFYKFSIMKKPELEKIQNNIEMLDNLSLLDMGMMTAFVRYIETGNFKYLEYQLNQIIGKPKENIKIEDTTDRSDELKELREYVETVKKSINDK